MYISNNSSNIGMATVLQQQQQQQQNQNQKNCMKTLTNGSGNDATANHNKWCWQQQFESAALTMQYGMKSHQPQHPTSHLIAANNNPSNNNSCTQITPSSVVPSTGTGSGSGSGSGAGTGTGTGAASNDAAAAATAVNGPPAHQNESSAAEEEPQPEIDIMINNVVCSFSVRCHLNLREIAQNGFNVEYRRENGMVTMKLRRPYTTASIWSSGRITCTGATSEDQAKIAARRYARCLEKLGFRVRFHNFRVVNVLGTCSMPWAIKIVNFSERYKKEASYEPELHPGVTYKLRYPKATLKIFSTGSITVTASCVANVQAAIEHIFPLVYEFRKERSPEEKIAWRNKQRERNLASGIVEVVEEEEGEIEKSNNHQHSSATTPAAAVGSTVAATAAASVDAVILQRKRQLSSTTTEGAPVVGMMMNNKKRLLNGGHIYTINNDMNEDIDEPSDPEEPTFKYTQFDDPEDLIEGPDDDEDDGIDGGDVGDDGGDL